MDKNKNAVPPIPFQGVLFSVITLFINKYLTSTGFEPLQPIILYTCVTSGLAISALSLFTPKDVFQELFTRCKITNGEQYPLQVRKVKQPYGYDVYFKCPAGVSLTDFERQRECFEQYLNAEIGLSYVDGLIKIKVLTGKLQSTYPFKPYKTASPVELVVGYSREGLETVDLIKRVHLLVSGETGGGKSVCLRSMITNLILTKTVKQLKIHLVDFKRVELGIFKRSGMITSFTSEIDEFKRLLESLGAESERRYKLFESQGLVNIQGWNSKHRPQLPYNIVFIDEIATLEGEKDILRLLKRRVEKDRACGIHYVICTQRPSAEILPGSLKANIPTRISFKTVNITNSLIILDEPGAERLNGSGHGLLKFNSTKQIQTMFIDEQQAQELIKHTFVQSPVVPTKKACSTNQGVLRIDNKACTGSSTFPSSSKGGSNSDHSERQPNIASNRKV